jgi:hypothetical protein
MTTPTPRYIPILRLILCAALLGLVPAQAARASGSEPAGHLSAAAIVIPLGREATVSLRLPEDVPAKEFTSEAAVLSGAAEGGLGLALDGLTLRLKANAPGEYRVAVEGFKPSPLT